MSNISKNSFARDFQVLLTPSLFSGCVAVLSALTLTASAMLIASLQTSGIGQTIFAVHRVASAQVAGSYQTVTANLSRYSLFNQAVLFVFWLGVGILVYFFLNRIFRTLAAAADIKHELKYVHAQRFRIVVETLLHLIERIIALTAWILIVSVSFHKLLPYDLATGREVVKNLNLTTALEALGAMLLIVVDITLQTVCLRLLFLRRRVFHSIE